MLGSSEKNHENLIQGFCSAEIRKKLLKIHQTEELHLSSQFAVSGLHKYIRVTYV